MPIIRCPHCDDRVEIDDDWYGRRINCPSCDQTFTPKRAGRSDDRDEDERPSRRRASDDDDRDRDDRPRRRSRSDADDRPAKSGGGVKWVLIIVGGLLVLGCGGCIGTVVWFMNTKASFTDPWADHSAGNAGVVTASFPKTPLPKFLSVTGSTDSQVIGYDNTTDGGGLDAIFAVGYFDFPAGTDPLGPKFDDIRRAVEGAFDVAPVIQADIVGDRKTTFNGYPAREVTYSKEDGGYTLRLIHLTDRPPGSGVRVVVVFAGGMHTKEEDKQKFLNSVRIGGKK